MKQISWRFLKQIRPGKDVAMPEITMEKFRNDSQGRTFRDILEVCGENFNLLLQFFSDEARQIRMEDSERHHDRPALAGVVRELENHTLLSMYLSDSGSFDTKRFRQAVGVIVRIIMEERGWKKVGRRGALGQKPRKDMRDDNEQEHNTSGLSWWFSRVERYTKAAEAPYAKVGHRLPESLGGWPDAIKEKWETENRR